MQAVGNHGVRLLFDPFCDVSVRWSTSGWIVFEAAESRRIVRWRNDNAVREAARAAAIVRENGVRDYRGRSVAILTYNRSRTRSEEHTSELQSLAYLVCRLLLEKKKKE